MMRRAVIGSLVVVVAVLAPTAALANSTVVSRIGVPAPLAFHVDASQCAAGASVASLHHITGPATPPLGAGSLEVAVAKKSAADLTADLNAAGLPLGDLTALSMASYIPKGSAAMTDFVQIVTQPNGSNDFYQLKVQLPGSVAEWTPFDVLNSSVILSWSEFNTGSPGTSIGNGTSSYDNFAAAHSSLLLDTVGVTTANCGGSTRFLDLDDLKLGLNSSTTTVNFEPAVATRLVGHLTAKLVRYHKAVTPSAKLTAAGKPFAGKSVSLWMKPAGATNYRQLGSLVTNSNGVATGPVQHPEATTSYQWRYAGDGTTHSPSTSTPDTVGVRSKVSLALERKSVSKGQSVAGGGSVTPRHAKLKIALWAEAITGKGKHQTTGKPVTVGTTKLRRDGTYTVSGKLGPGHYKVFTTAAADSTNSAGRSAAHKFTVRP